jgi:hypothetical protein
MLKYQHSLPFVSTPLSAISMTVHHRHTDSRKKIAVGKWLADNLAKVRAANAAK